MVEVETEIREEEERAPRNRLGWLLLAAALGILGSRFVGPKAPAVGMDAPVLSLSLLGGGEERLEDLRGRVVVLDFWATWCPPCVKSLPVVHRVAAELAPSGLVLLAVNRDDGPGREERVKAFLERHGLGDLPVALDDGMAAGSFGVRALPTLVIVGRDGRVQAAHVGAMGEEALRDLFRGALAAGS